MAIPFNDDIGNYDNELFVSYNSGISIIEYRANQELINSLLLDKEIKIKANKKHKFIEVTANRVSFYPIITLLSHPKYLESKYSQIKKISLDGFNISAPKTNTDVLSLLEALPTGFIKTYTYGLGFIKDLRFIIDSIENNLDVEHLVISKEEKTRIETDVYVLNYDDFEEIRKGINRITRKFQREALGDKRIFSFNALLNQVQPDGYPERFKPYKKDTIFKFVSGSEFNKTKLSKPDSEAIIDLIAENKKTIFKNNEKQLIELNEDIDLINLESLVNKTEHLLSKNSSEDQWQQLLSDNPVILSFVYGYPVIKIGEQASLGGRKISGRGEKVTDFLVKNSLTNNIAIIEIKKPNTKLLGNKEYRGGVYAPSSELSGSINQLLDQKYQLQKQIAQIKENSGIYDMESFSVDSVLIIGKIPSDKDRIKSLELFRNNSKDIKIITFDELVSKLKDLYNLLKNDVGE